MQTPTSHFDHLYPLIDAFPRPDWDAVVRFVNQQDTEAAQAKTDAEFVRDWVVRLRAALGGDHQLHESDHFFLIRFRGSDQAAAMLGWAERCRSRLMDNLEELAQASPQRKHLIIDFEDDDDFYDYAAYFHGGDSDIANCSGICLYRDDCHSYPHIALNTGSDEWTRTVLAHELTHDLLSHLSLPRWIEEGIAMVMESTLGEKAHEDLNVEPWLQPLWVHGLNPFWAGGGLSVDHPLRDFYYTLARDLVYLLNQTNPDRFTRFVVRADPDDAGEAAAKEILGTNLGELAQRLLGPGEWGPRGYNAPSDPDR